MKNGPIQGTVTREVNILMLHLSFIISIHNTNIKLVISVILITVMVKINLIILKITKWFKKIKDENFVFLV